MINSLVNYFYDYYYLILTAPAIYLLAVFIFDLLLRGFSPFIKSRPWVPEQILNDLVLKKKPKRMLALSTGRSGFFNEIGKLYQDAELIAVEPSFFQFLVARTQAAIRRTGIKIYWQKIHRADVKDFDFIYSHLYPDNMQGLGLKLKFECAPGTVVLSAGFNIPVLRAKKIILLPDRKGRLDFLSKNQKLFQPKRKKFKKENKAFVYEI